MIYFDNVKITNDKKLVGIVKSDNDQIQVGKIYINTQDNYQKETGREILQEELTPLTDENGYSFIVDLIPTSDNDPYSFNLDKDLIILTAEPATPNEEETVAYEIVDCCHKKPATAMAYYQYCMFNKALNYVKTLCNDCEINKDFIDFILRHNSLDLAIKCGDVELAIKLWNLLFNKNVKSVITKTCGCHGR